jgi:hypothetical protein
MEGSYTADRAHFLAKTVIAQANLNVAKSKNRTESGKKGVGREEANFNLEAIHLFEMFCQLCGLNSMLHCFFGKVFLERWGNVGIFVLWTGKKLPIPWMGPSTVRASHYS